MKAFLCKTKGCAGHPQFPGVATLSDGSPYLIGQPPAHFSYRLHCATCKRKTLVSKTDFNALPQIQPEDITHIKGNPTDPKDHADFAVMTRSLLASLDNQDRS